MVVRSVAMFLPQLPHGGAERVAVNLAHEFIDKGLAVTFVLQQAKGDLLAALPSEVDVVALEQKRTLACVVPLLRFLNKEKPDILLSHLSHNNIVSIWAGMLARARTHVVVVQHNTLSVESRVHRGWQYRLLPLFYRLFLRFADGIVAVSNGVADDLAKVSWLPRRRVQTIYGASRPYPVYQRATRAEAFLAAVRKPHKQKKRHHDANPRLRSS